eukprot:TRINITY_DN24328_c0_g1_i2.p2 TRINITY_DN24328_c0_g1~~TRINITY_DN24328_c0_g1_i2.p2  ORF type:complete len:129 (-),score=25.12 TRINITY_DN24328_c0_g1_i2:213-599(-)
MPTCSLSTGSSTAPTSQSAPRLASQMCPQIRDLFVSILIFCSPANPLDLYTQHHHQWWDDLQHRHRTDDPDLLEAMVLLDLEERLELQNKTLSVFNLGICGTNSSTTPKLCNTRWTNAGRISTPSMTL